MKNINKNNIWIFRNLLAKKCAELQKKIDKNYGHQYTKKEPVLKLVIEISHDEFVVAVLEKDNEILTKRLTRANKKLREYEEAAKEPKRYDDDTLHKQLAEQMQLDADLGFDDDEGDCPRCRCPLMDGVCSSCDYPGPSV